MKILYYFADYGTNMEQWQYIHFIDELKHHNVEIDVFNPVSFETLDIANAALVGKLKADCSYDLFMSTCGYRTLYPSTMEEISCFSIPKLLICIDNLHNPYAHKKILKYFDLVWITSYETKEMMQTWGAKTIFMPYAANPYTFVATPSTDIPAICFIGTPYGTRSLKINKLTSNDVRCDIFYGLPHNIQPKQEIITKKRPLPAQLSPQNLLHHLSFDIGRKMMYGRFLSLFYKCHINKNNEYLNHYPSVSFDNMVKLYSDYALDLNVLELRNTYLLKKPVFKLHLRTFEIPMCGGIQFTTYNEELSSYYKDGKEIVFYKDDAEFIDKAKFYLDDKRANERASIRNAARARSLREHTWWMRFTKIFDILNIAYERV